MLYKKKYYTNERNLLKIETVLSATLRHKNSTVQQHTIQLNLLKYIYCDWFGGLEFSVQNSYRPRYVQILTWNINFLDNHKINFLWFHFLFTHLSLLFDYVFQYLLSKGKLVITSKTKTKKKSEIPRPPSWHQPVGNYSYILLFSRERKRGEGGKGRGVKITNQNFFTCHLYEE